MNIPETIQLSRWLLMLLIFLYFIIDIAAVVVVLKENRNPIRALSWVIALLFLPMIGLIFYLFFGRSMRGEMMSHQNKRRLMNNRIALSMKLKDIPVTADSKTLISLGEKLSGYPYTNNNEIEIFINGEDKFRQLKADLKNAKKSILLQYYIFLDDKIGTEISDILIKKAQEGIEVKVIYDHVGSFSAKNSFFKKMQNAGVEIHPFFRVNFPQFANRINWRNHRKIVVIDGIIGYIGGMNIADRYVNKLYKKGKKTGIWRDTHFRVKGDILESLLYSFVIDWNFQKNDTYLPVINKDRKREINNRGIQLVTDGPIGHWNNLSLMFLKAISSAKRLIWIQTPYFLPTDALFNALQAAALAHVDVRIMMPEHTDSILLHYASFSYISQSLDAGIKIYLYQPGMLHAKAMMIDDNLVTAGSTNFDFRSFENNFECNLFIYDPEVNSQMREIFYNDMRNCRKIKKEEWRKRSLGQRFLESLLHPLSPLL